MTLFGRINRRAVTWDKLYGDGSPPVHTASGKSVSETSALKYSVVWAAVNLIADAVSLLTPEAYTIDESGAVVPQPVPRWIESPHPEMRRGEVWSQLLISALLWGNGYGLLIRRDSDGVIVGVLPLKPKDVTCEWDPNRRGYRRYRVNNGPWLTSGDVLHVMGPTLPGEATGMSVIGQAREAIGLGLTLEEFGARYFAQGSMAKVVIKVPGKVLTEQQALDLVKTYERFHRGPGNWHRPAVLSGGGEIENISIPPEDAQFLQSREFQALDVARWFRVPPHRVGIMTKQSSWGSGLSEENMAMVQHTFRPWIRRFEDVFTSYAPGGEDRGLRIRLQDAELLRGTFKEQVESWGTAVEKFIATPNEARKAIGLDPIDGGDELMKPPEPPAPSANSPAENPSRAYRFNEAHDELGRFSSKGTIKAGTRYSDLDPKGQAAVDAAMEKYGLTPEALDAEIESMLTPENLEMGREWYREARQFNAQIAEQHGLSLEQATAITSAVSPRTPWPRNKYLAEKIAAKHRDHPDDMHPKEVAGRIGGGLTSNMAPAVSIARGGAVDQNLTGIKRRSFYNNMLRPGETDDVTVDVWMMRSTIRASSKPLTDVDANAFTYASKVSTKGGAGYVAISESVRRVATKRGLSPDEVQAGYWVGVAGSKEGLWGRNAA